MPDDTNRLSRLEEKLDKLGDALSDLRVVVGQAMATAEKVADLKLEMVSLRTQVEDLRTWKTWVVGAAAGVGLLSGSLPHIIRALVSIPSHATVSVDETR